MAEQKKAKWPLKISIFEFVVYIITGLLGIWGIVYMVLGLAVSFARYDSALKAADLYLRTGTSNMGFLLQGILITSIALVVAVIVLLVAAKGADRDYEKAQRRAALRSARRFGKEEIVVDAEVSETK